MIHFFAPFYVSVPALRNNSKQTVLDVYVSELPVAYTIRWFAYLNTIYTSFEYF